MKRNVKGDRIKIPFYGVFILSPFFVRKTMIKNYIKIARPDHWVKNAFILPGVVIAFLLAGSRTLDNFAFNIFAGFFATCFIASANYVINEWLDAEFDKYHPVKKNRPVVSSSLKGGYVYLEYAALAILGIGLSLMVNKWFLICELWLLVMGILYNVKPVRTKDIPYIDVLSESVNNLIRFLIGWYMITDSYFPPVSILFGYWMTGAFLMGTKRFAEYRMIGDPEVAGLYRKSFKYYEEKTLLASSFFYGICATFFIGVFLAKYKIEFIFTIPFMFLLFAYYMMLAFDEDSVVQKPEKLYKSRILIILVIITAVVFVVMYNVDIEWLQSFKIAHLIEIPEGNLWN